MKIRIPDQSIIARITHWTTKERQQIPIKKMASSHLLAAIHMIEKKRFERMVDTATRIESEDMEILEIYAQFPIEYYALLQEAERRGLIMRVEVPTGKGLVKR